MIRHYLIRHVLPSLSALAALSLACGAQKPSHPPVSKKQTTTRAQTNEEARHEILRLYQIGDAAYDNRNAEAGLALLAPDFVFTDEKDTKITFAQISPLIKATFERNKRLTHVQSFTKTTPVSIQIKGDRANVLWNLHQEAISRSETSVVDAQDESTGEDTWIRTSAGWRLQSTHRLTFQRKANVSITPQAQLALQQVQQSKQLLEDFLAGRRIEAAREAQMRVEQEQYERRRRENGRH